ncbi:MAG: S8 family serine peptidase, partial [Bacteroidetes bacterium]|nr:S8 family serine peptidase [Bacteroidota bacterium]
MSNTLRLPSDDRFKDQWYLYNTDGRLDLNLIDVWPDYTGKGINIVVIDSGYQYDHPDLVANYQLDQDWDFINNDDIADPQYETNNDGEDTTILNSHGTNVMGIIGAARDGQGVVGIAYDANLIGFTSPSSDALKATAYTSNNQFTAADVVSMSRSSSGLFSSSTKDDTIEKGAEDGRDGLGTVYVFSAGNYRGEDTTNAEEAHVSRHSIVVAAVGVDGNVMDFSNPGASLLVSAFGDKSIATTDLNSGYREDFNATSAATPMVASIVALMLEANPQLGWRDVQNILAYSARHVGSRVGTQSEGHEIYEWGYNNAKNWNGGGLHFSNDYGFGLIDAKAAVRLAETWRPISTSANEVTHKTTKTKQPSLYDDKYIDNRTETIDLDPDIGNSKGLVVEYVEISIQITVGDLTSDMKIVLISPDGTSSVVLDPADFVKNSNPTNFGEKTWTFGSNKFRGEIVDGTGKWRVEITDKNNNATLVNVDNIKLTLYGAEVTDGETFIFTEEFSEVAGDRVHITDFSGRDGGKDVINAAAVDANSVIDLRQGTGTIDGVVITISDIEVVFTGDGDDRIVSGQGDEEIDTGRGDDTVVYSGDFTHYNVYKLNDGSFLVHDIRDASPDGIDHLYNVETLQFNNTSISLLKKLPYWPAYNDVKPSLDPDKEFNDQVFFYEGDAVNLQLPDALFVGRELILWATLADGTALPDWLNFDPTTNQFSGNPPDGVNGTFSIKITAYNLPGESQEHVFNLTFNQINNAPTIDVTAITLYENSAKEGDVAATYTTYDEEDASLTVTWRYTRVDSEGNTLYELDTGRVLLTKAGADWVNAGNDLPSIKLRVTDEGNGTLNTSSRSNTATPETILVNDAPTLKIIIGDEVYENSVVAGHLVATYDIDDEEGDNLTVLWNSRSEHFVYEGGVLGKNMHNGEYGESLYILDAENNQVLLTEAGAAWVNAGNKLPDIRLGVRDDGDPPKSNYKKLPITVISENDAPTIVVDAKVLIEDAAFGTVNDNLAIGNDSVVIAATYTTNDEEEESANLTVTWASESGSPVHNGEALYYLDTEHNRVLLTDAGLAFVNAGNDLPVIELTVTDDGTPNKSDSDSADPVVTLVNDAADITGDITGVVNEDAEAPTITGQLMVSDEDGTDNIFQSITDGIASYGTYDIDQNGNWTYTLKNELNAVNELGARDMLEDSIEILTEDGTSQKIIITITGTNDTPIIEVIANDFIENTAGGLEGDISDGDLLAVGRSFVAATYTTADEEGDSLTVTWANESGSPVDNDGNA